MIKNYPYQTASDEPDNFYYTMSLTNTPMANGPETLPIFSTVPINIQYDLNQPLLRDPSKYEVTIDNMYIPANNLPFMIFQQNPGTDDITSGSYIIKIMPYDGNNSVLFADNWSNVQIVESTNYEPNNYTLDTVLEPVDPSINSRELYYQQQSPYYWIPNVNKFIDMLNNTLVGVCDAYDNIIIANPGIEATSNLINTHAGPVLTSFNYPYFTYNESTKLISLIVPTSMSLITGARIWIDKSLYSVLPAFDYNFQYFEGPNGENITTGVGDPAYEFNIVRYPANVVFTDLSGNFQDYYYMPAGQVINVNAPSYTFMTQQISSLPFMNCVKSIIVQSNMLTRESNLNTNSIVCNKTTTYSKNNAGILTANDQFNQVLQSTYQPYYSLYEMNTYTADTLNNILAINPRDLPKFVDLVSTIPLTKIGIQVFFQDNFNRMYPVNLSVFQTVKIRLYFKKKTGK